MQLIRCTAKLIKEMGLKKSDLIKESPKFSYLGQWHANLIYINRRKCILFANDRTLVNFIVPDVARSEIREIGEMFRDIFRCILVSEGYEKAVVERILAEYSEVGYGKSNNRSVLGSLNDLAFHYEHRILSCGGVKTYEIPSIIKELNRMPMLATKSTKFPIDELHKLYATAS